MGLPKKNMKLYCANSWDVVQSVVVELMDLDRDSLLTMTIQREKSEGSSVFHVIVSSSADTEKNLAAWPYLETQPNT